MRRFYFLTTIINWFKLSSCFFIGLVFSFSVILSLFLGKPDTPLSLIHILEWEGHFGYFIQIMMIGFTPVLFSIVIFGGAFIFQLTLKGLCCCFIKTDV